jgi:glycosyltransferase involved in cell wall biosynthesis
MSRPRVLLIAEAANPEWVSVPLEGWSHARAIAAVAEAHLVTQVRNREAIRRAGLREGDEFTAIDSEKIARPAWKFSELVRGGSNKGWTMATAIASLTYWYFEKLVWREFGAKISARRFDVVHRLTPLSPTTPSSLAGRCARAGVPFVMGPINGGVPWPKGFDSERRREKEWLSYVRSAHRLLPGYRATRDNAAAIIVGSRDTMEQMGERWKAKCVYIPENGHDPARFAEPSARAEAPPLRVVFVGRLVPYKGADMLLAAAAPLVREGLVRVEIIGDGPELPALKALAAREGLGEGVVFAGWVPHQQIAGRMGRAHVLGFPSVREFGGAVVLEAMALGVVPVVVAYGGPGELVTGRTGLTVPIGTREQIVGAVRECLARLAADSGLLAKMSEAARRRAAGQFTWAAKASQVLEVYEWVMGRRPDKPEFGMPFPDPEESATHPR